MTPNIPRCATWPPYTWNTTEPEQLAEAEAWVESLYTERVSIDWTPTEARLTWPPPKPTHTPYRTYAGIPLPEDPVLDALLDEERTTREHQSWPPPKPGTHESDLRISGAIEFVAGVDDPTAPGTGDRLDKFRIAQRWSKENAR